MYKHEFDNTILRSYDIRGVFEKTLKIDDAFMLGYFFGITLKKQKKREGTSLSCNWDGWPYL